MPRSEYDEDEAYDSVGEDAELELSCALHDLAERVKIFEENMKGRLRITGIDGTDDDGEEIGEDIPEIDDDDNANYGHASPKKATAPKNKHGQRRRRTRGTKASQAKQQADDDEDDDGNWSEDVDEDEEGNDDEDEDGGHGDAKGDGAKATVGRHNARNEWDEQNEREELSEIKHNISKLLQGFQAQAKALDADNQ